MDCPFNPFWIGVFFSFRDLPPREYVHLGTFFGGRHRRYSSIQLLDLVLVKHSIH
jgi:hypothetical protein